MLTMFILVLCTFNVQGLSKGEALPESLNSFQPEHVLSYIHQLQDKLLNSPEENQVNNLDCYQNSTAALREVTTKSEKGNKKCKNLLSEAKKEAKSQLEKDRISLDKNSKAIQDALGRCGNATITKTTNEALDCYETEGQKNINPVSTLSSQSRTFKRNYNNTLSIAKSDSDGCSYDVSAQSESISAQIYSILNNCIATGIWKPIEIPDLPLTNSSISTNQTTTARPTKRPTISYP